MDLNEYIVEFSNVSKRFVNVQALEDVSFGIKSNQVHAVVGENGAGKSTLMNILAGVFPPTKGQIMLRGKPIRIINVKHAQTLGIGVVYQELNLCPSLTVAENIFLGREIQTAKMFADRSTMLKETKKLLDLLGIELSPNVRVRELSVAKQQMTEIAKALSLGAKILILDEPNSALTERETEILFDIIHGLRVRGTTIIYVSHKLSEVLKIADQITILRDGRHIATLSRKETNIDQVIHMMIGRNITDLFPEHKTKEEDERSGDLLEVRNLSKSGRFRNISFKITQGEVVGFSGLAGAGRRSVVRAIFGLEKFDSGEILMNGRRVDIKSPSRAIKLGLGFVPSDRRGEGILPRMPVRENITLIELKKLVKWGLLNRLRMDTFAQTYIDRLSIRTPDLSTKAANLSGGNQQKVVVARMIAIKPKILILDEPTQGIDVGTKAEIHKMLRQLADQGLGVLMISSELPEILGMSDRIIVMHEGQITGHFSGQEATEQKIMECATGVTVH
ncbi:MAG: sugar ABC transporter ATP-binding protein [Actinobacteria bacterium]|nr:sugar ABC transporter ATP-binding protein [Actinomycetota bacterium]